MKTIADLMSYFRNLDIKIWADGDRLRYNAPKGVLTPELRDQLKEHKAEILDFLQEATRLSGISDEPIQPVKRQDELPLSFAQERMWFLSELEGPESYNMPMLFRIKGPLNISVFEQSVNEIIRRHEVLRTSFVMVKGKLEQIIASELTITIPAVDLHDVADSEISSMIQQIIQEKAQTPFDLAKAPLLQVTLVRLGHEEHVVILTMHHMISDGWSLGIFLQELGTLYDTFLKGKPSLLPPLPFQYVDFAHWQRQQWQSKSLETSLAYWKKKLAGVSSTWAIPTDFPRSAIKTSQGAYYSLQFLPNLVVLLNTFNQQQTVTPFITMLSALKILLFRWTQQTDLVIGTVIANRNPPETEKLIGCFINFLAMRSQFSEDQTGLELLKQVQTTVVEAYSHKDCPFEKVIEALNPERKFKQKPIYDTTFLLQNFPLPPNFSENLEVSLLSSNVQPSVLDLRFVAHEFLDGMRLRCEYNTALFTAGTIKDLVHSYCNILEQLVQHPETRLSQFKLVEALEARTTTTRAHQQTLVIATPFAIESLEESLRIQMQTFNMPCQIIVIPYPQTFQELFASESPFARNQDGMNVILVRFEDWKHIGNNLLPRVTDAEKEQILAGKNCYTLPNGMEIAHLNKYETEYSYQEIFLDQMYWKHGIILPDNACIFDIGANIGLCSLFLQQKCPSATIYAFEPAPHVFNILQSNIALYCESAEAFNYGLGNDNAEATFTFYPRSSLLSSYQTDPEEDKKALRTIILNMLQQNNVIEEDMLNTFADELLEGRLERESVIGQTKTLSRVIKELNVDRIDLLKIDVERSELDVLRGIEDGDWLKIQQIVIEVDESLLQEIMHLLKERGFDLVVDEETLLEGSGFYNIYAIRPEQKQPVWLEKSEVYISDLEKNIRDFGLALKTAVEYSATPYLICICPPSPSVAADANCSMLYKRMGDRLISEVESISRVYLIPSSELTTPLSQEFFTALGTEIAQKFYSIKHKPDTKSLQRPQSFAQDMKLHHVGFACRDIEKGIRHVKTLYDIKYISDIVFDELQNTNVCLIETNNNITLELVAGSEVEALLDRGVSLYQVCYEVPDIFQAIKHFQTEGAIVVSEPKPAKLFNNRLVTFLNTELGLIELLEKTPSKGSSELAKEFNSTVARYQKQTIAITATFTADPIEEALAFWMPKFDMPSQVKFAPYHQVFQQLLDPSSLLSKNDHGLNVVLVRFEDWQKYKSDSEPLAESFSQGCQEIERNVRDLILALKSAREGSTTPYLVCVCPVSPELLTDTDRTLFFKHMEEDLESALQSIRGMYVITSQELLTMYPTSKYSDPHGDQLGHIPYTPEFFAALGTMLVRKFLAIKRVPYKVIVLDCDGTLWKGVCGEDGPLGIEIDHPHKALQEFMVDQYQAGRLLCLCSKNNEADVLEVFERRPEMPLKKEHLVSMQLNWQPKSTNIHALAEELQLGLDSFIFVDDNPVECGEVQANCPEVLTLQLPQEPERIPKFLQHIWAFDHIKVTEEDKRRTERYQQNIQRERFQKEALTFRDFLANLDLHIHIAEMVPDQLSRVSQLTQRTNQFNMTTIRRTESEIQALLNSGKYECLVTEVSDRFGEYGLVGVMIFGTQTDAINVDTFLLSCRALGRGVEHRMLAYLGELAKERGLNTIKVPYLPTQKNQPAIDFLEHIGVSYKAQGDTGWIFTFPTEIAAALTYDPEIEVPQTSSFVPADKLQAGRSQFREVSQLFTRIAIELYDAKNILKAIHSQKRQARPTLKEDFVAPRTPVEEVLVGIWSEVLGIEGVGIYDNFFNLGGHSLLGAQVLSRVNETFQVELPLQSLFSARTVAGLAEQIETDLQTRQRIKSLPLRPIPRDGDLPLSFAQQRLWFLHQLVPDRPFYNIPAAVRLVGQLNVDTLTQCLNEIVRRHEVLRTNFVTVDGQPGQVISPTLHVSVPVVDLQHLSKEERSLKLQRLLTQEVQRPFDITTDSLLRVTLFRLETEEHVLLLTIHHIVSDGWSMGVFIQEAAALYKAFSQGEPFPKSSLDLGGEVLPELPVQYVDFAHWQRQWLTGEVLQTQLNYWKHQLAGNPPMLELPTDRPRPPIQTFRGSTEYVKIRSDLTEQLSTLCQQSEVTLFMALLAAFTTLLFRYSGQEDILIGSPIANRNRREIEPLIGFFVNTLVLRIDFSGNPTFRELLDQVRQVALDAYTHQDFPFDRLVEEIRPERHLNQNPLVQVVFAFQNMPIQPWNLPNLRLSPFEFDSGITKFDLEFYLWEESEGLNGYFVYNPDLFDAATITRMAGHFRTLLEGIVNTPQRRVSELPLLTDAERHQILVEWNDTKADYPRNKCIQELFETQTERTPDAIAVVFEEEQLTYWELNRRANQLAHYLRSIGVEQEVLVGICVERSVEMLVGLLGILKAGGAYVPLDPAYPQERLTFMLEDTKTPILLTQQRLAQRLLSSNATIVCLDSEWETIALQSKENLLNQVNADNLAYVMYTSGSTGKPKGTSIPHRGVVRLVKETDYADLNSEEVFLQLAPISFDASTFEIWGSLLNGARLVIMPPSPPSLEELGQAIQKHHVTTLWLTAGLFHVMVEQRLEDLRSLHQLLAGGDVLSVPHVCKVLQHLDKCRLINGYGPTENTTFTCCFTIKDVEQSNPSVPIGRPIANTQVYILDPYLQLVPISVPGELHVGGDGLARDYLNRPELTEKKFILNPFSGEPGARLYKTGDLARYLPDGNIEFLGRIDHQVKIRGFRIEPGEIETTLSQHPAVQETVVIVREDGPGNKRLVAYVVETKNEGQRANSTELREYLKTKLPEYMIPSAFVLLEALPLTPNGKVDRRALPAPDISERSLEDNFVPPCDELELQLARIWEDILNVHPIGVQDNFFDLGGHSLLAVHLIAQIQKQFERKLPLVTLFQCPTIEYLASILRQQPDSQSWSPVVAIQSEGSQPPLFFVHTAGGIVFCYAALARHLGQNQPFYGFQARGLEEGQEPHIQVEGMARYYIDALQVVQPQGPYFLGGWSFGGLVAFEMAQQLLAQGQQVAFLAILDTLAPFPERPEEIWITDETSLLVALFAYAKDMRMSVEHLQQLGPDERLIYVLEEAKRVNLLSPNTELTLLRRFLDMAKIQIQAARNYAPQCYSGKVTLFQAIEADKAVKEIEIALQISNLGWEDFTVKGVETYKVPGTHHSMMREPHVRALAEKLQACLERAQVDE